MAVTKGKLEARLLYRGCLVAFDGYCGTSKTAAERETKNEIMTFSGFAWAWLALAGQKAIPWLVARFRDFLKLRACATEPGQDPHSHRGVHAGLLRAPQPRARKETAAGRKSFEVLFCGVCGFRVRVWGSYRNSSSFGDGYGAVTELTEVSGMVHGCTELTEVPGGCKKCCTRTPGILARGVQDSQKFRVRV